METNITDSAAVAADLRTLSDQLAELESSLGANPDVTPANAANATLPVDIARIVLIGLLAWLAVPAIVAIWVGWRWYRPALEHSPARDRPEDRQDPPSRERG